MGAVLSYQAEITKAMTLLAHDPRTLFVGQSVRYDGQRLHKTLEGVPMTQRIEMPVIEDFQMGYCLGMALEGFVPISIYPRWDFLLLAANQLVNHVDKMPTGWKGKVIVRVAAGATAPLDPGPQHTQDHTAAFRLMLRNVDVKDLTETDDIVPAYFAALRSPYSTILVEHMSHYA